MARTRSSHTEKLRARRSGRRQSKSTLRRPGSASSGARRGLASALGKIEGRLRNARGQRGRKSTAAKVLESTGLKVEASAHSPMS